MTEPIPEPQHQEPEPGTAMPRWVPILIGAVLVTMAGLAVYTGLRYRNEDTLLGSVQPRRESSANPAPAPPGEPGAGASLVMHGSEGDNTPSANEPVAGSSRAVISGGPGGVETTVRIWARRGMLLQITPPESMVYVNDTLVGQASQFDTEDEIYDFPAPGSYTVRVVGPGEKQKTYIVTAADDAKQDVAHIKAQL
jgi:hypothetical protein